MKGLGRRIAIDEKRADSLKEWNLMVLKLERINSYVGWGEEFGG